MSTASARQTRERAGGTEGGEDAVREPMPFKERATAFIERHQVLSGGVIALAVAAAFGLVFWFTIFSGLSSSADFIYSQF